jgi:putative PIN family toxin of toxin-antitoxin system
VAFGGNPGKIVDKLWDRAFLSVTSPLILDEVRRALTSKLVLDPIKMEKFLFDFLEISTVLTPPGVLTATGYAPDDLVLETAVLGGCDVLVTGDKRHLLPLNPYKNLTIEAPSSFLERFETEKMGEKASKEKFLRILAKAKDQEPAPKDRR